jgi:mannose-6-phosphate isomerase-like protein (cupin superfamily)
MSTPADYPYTTNLDIKYPHLTRIDVPEVIASVEAQWFNQTLCQVNDSVVRLGVMQGEYHWHKHDNDDELFFVLEGTFIVDLEDRSVELTPQQGFVVPKGVIHRTRAPERAIILMLETAAIVPTGDD